MAVELITGHAATPHVSADDAATFNKAIFGGGNYVLNGCAVSVESANAVSIAPGNMLLEGRHVRITTPQMIDNIENGTSGYKRIDTLAVHYHKELSGVESVDFKVVKGTPAQRNPVHPKMPGDTSGIGQAMDVYVPFATIRITDLTPNVEKILIPSGAVPIASGGTGAANRVEALKNLGISWGTDPAPTTGEPNTVYFQII